VASDDGTGTTLAVDELALRPWRETDAPALLAACQDPEIARWVTIPLPYGPADADAFIASSQAMWRDATGAPFAIVES
jgi:RimJ/RimL family protein N-acetyltransferase